MRSVDVSNRENNVARWSQAIDHYTRNCAGVREARTPDLCRCTAIIDISGSMEGKKLTAVKLGLCSLISGLDDCDEMNITAFASHCFPVTDGFLPVLQLRNALPALLADLRVDGCTACYDAIIQGIHGLRNRIETHPNPSMTKNISVVLTDGEDNESKFKPVHVEHHLCSPGISSFMFIMVAVAMTSREERHFRRWMDMGHCKQISVSVKTGSSLVGVFKEMMLSRILQSEVTGGRFLEDGGVALQHDPFAHNWETSTEAFNSIRQSLMRRRRRGGEGGGDVGQDDNGDVNMEDMGDGYESDGVSCVSSCSGGDGAHSDGMSSSSEEENDTCDDCDTDDDYDYIDGQDVPS